MRLHIEHLPFRAFLWPIASFLLITGCLVGLYFIYTGADPWELYKEAGGNAMRFCEKNRLEDCVKQPSNTWSNLGYLCVGIFCLSLGINDIKRRKAGIVVKNYIVKYPVFSILIGVSSLYLFIGSFFYHASLTLFFQKLDITGVYAVVLSVMAYNFYRLFPVIKRKGKEISTHKLIVLITILLNLAFFFGLWKVEINALFPALCIITFSLNFLYLKFRDKNDLFQKYLFAALSLMFLAGMLWILDVKSVICAPQSILQGHAVWHLFTAASLLFIYFYFRSKPQVSFAQEPISKNALLNNK